MPTTTVIFDGPEFQTLETTSAPEKNPDSPGGWRSQRQVWKAGSTGGNEAILHGQLETLFDNLRTVANGTGTFANNTVRDAAIRNTARALVILIRLHQRKLEATD